jgi:hypothetical protein
MGEGRGQRADAKDRQRVKAVTRRSVNWQIWIQDGPQPFIRKLVITHKNEEGQPEFTALITRWDMTEHISDSDFTFEPPQGATKIEMRSEHPQGSALNQAKPLPLTTPKNER